MEAALLALVCVALTVPGGLEVARNEYLARGMDRAAYWIFRARYLEWLPAALVTSHLLLFIAYAVHGAFRTTLRKSVTFAGFSIAFAAILHQVFTYSILLWLTNRFVRFELVIHSFDDAQRPRALEATRMILSSITADPRLIHELFKPPFPQLVLLVALHLTAAVGLAALLFWLVGRAMRSRRDWEIDHAHPRVRLVSSCGAWLFAFLALPALILAAEPYFPHAARDGRPNLVLVSIDTLRADHVSAYGYSEPTTPTIDMLARDGLLFTRAISQSSWTLPAHVSMLTGLYPIEHGCDAVLGVQLSRRVETLPEALLESGYTTMAVTGGHLVSPAYGLGQGFETFHYRRAGANELVDVAIEHVRHTADKPFFLFLHLFDPHDPYEPPWRYQEMFLGRGAESDEGKVDRALLAGGGDLAERIKLMKKLYDGEIRFTDDELGRLVSELRRLNVLDDTLFIITSDHGESFGENGEMVHGTALYSQQIHVPLILRWPGRIAPGVIGTTVEASVRLMPTILAAAGIPYSATGMALPLSADAPDSSGGIAYSETLLSVKPLYSAQNDEWKTIAATDGKAGPILRTSLYNAGSDREDTYDMAGDRPDVVGAFVDTLFPRYWILEKTSNVPRGKPAKLSPADIDTLKSLGYLN